MNAYEEKKMSMKLFVKRFDLSEIASTNRLQIK